jgi:hypothetical protein
VRDGMNKVTTINNAPAVIRNAMRLDISVLPVSKAESGMDRIYRMNKLYR